MRYLLIAIVGAALGMAMIWMGFSFRVGGPDPAVLLSGSIALLPAAIAGAVAALLIDYTIRKWT